MKLVKLGMICGALLVAACGGNDGTNGQDGAQGPAGPAGPAGDGNGAGVESINGITPARSFPGRTVRMTISGDNTNWSGTPTVTFDDPAITVASVTVASVTALVLEVQVGENAAIGEKTITADGKTFKGFQVQHALNGTLTGTQAQGSIVFYDVANNDPENLFDTTTDQDGNYVLFGASQGPDGVQIGATSVSAQSASFQILIDADAATGEAPITLESGLAGASFNGAEKLNITARAPIAFAAGDNAINLTPGSTSLFSIPAATGSKGNLFKLEAANSLLLLNLSDSGSWADWDSNTGYSGGFIKTTDGSPKIVVANFGSSAASTPIKAISLPLNARAEVEPNDTNGTATALADLNEGVYGAFSATADVDTYSVTLATATRLRVLTAAQKTTVVDSIFGPVTVQSDPVLEIFDGVGDLVMESDDANYQEDITTEDVLQPGTYFIRVTSSGTVNAQANDYALFAIAVP